MSCFISCWKTVDKKPAVAVIANRTSYDVWYSYRLLSGIAIVSMSIYLLTATNCCQCLVNVCQLCSRSLCSEAKRQILQHKVSE